MVYFLNTFYSFEEQGKEAPYLLFMIALNQLAAEKYYNIQLQIKIGLHEFSDDGHACIYITTLYSGIKY